MTRFLVVMLALSPAPALAAPVKVGSKNFTEQVILGEAICQVLRSAGLQAEHKSDLGGSRIAFDSLRNGGLDAYVEYTGTLTQELLKGKRIRDDDGLRRELDALGVVLGPRLGFANNYALGIRADAAARHFVTKISDLARVPELRMQLSDEFMGREDGWPAVKARYKLPQQPRALSHQMAVNALGRGQIDVTDVYTTDAEIKQYGIKLLEDDDGALAVYHAVLLWRKDLDPAAAAALGKLEGKISTDDMVEMNARVRSDRQTESDTAADLLHAKMGLPLPPGGPSYASRLAWSILGYTMQHLMLVLVSLAFAVAVAVPLGVIAYRRPKTGKAILATVSAVQTIPSMALLVFLLPLLGLGTWPALAALVLYSLLPIVRNTYAGLSELAPNLREAAEVIGLPPWARLWRIELPLASRAILSGIKTAAVINVGTATIGAIVGAGGYGQPILIGLRLNDMGTILSGAIPAALMALGVQALFGVLERFIVPRGLLV